jgi:8-oxo-dGTP pyrophosphatase MutT (NUDIX family)
VISMNMRFKDDKDFDDFLSEIGARLGTKERRLIEKPDYAPASVLMLLLNKDGEPHVLLTKRTKKVATHKGEVAFPGGKRDDADESSLATALRETEEEVGIRPSDVRIIGEFDEYFSIYGFHVSTFVGAVTHPYRYTLNRDELSECFEAPLSIFYEERYSRSECFNYEGRDVEVFYYDYRDYVIWGLTARILTDFSRKILRRDREGA